MVEKPDYRNYINPHPRLGKDAQIEAFGGEGTNYIEDKTGKVIERVIGSVRPKSIVRVVWPSLLAPVKGTAPRRRKLWAERADRIKAARGCVASMSPPLTGAKLAIAASEEIANLSRGRPGGGKLGRPNKMRDEELREKGKAMWQSRRYKTRAAAAEAIGKLFGKRITTSWCYSNFGLPSGSPEE